MKKQFQVGTYVKAYQDWRGKIKELSFEGAKIEWSYCGNLPTDICTFVTFENLQYVRKARLGKV